MANLELIEVEVPSPIKGLIIGDNFLFEGIYNTGPAEGLSKIKRFYMDVPAWDGVLQKPKKNHNGYPVWMELENNKCIYLGHIGYKDKFSISETFNYRYGNRI